jgi:uncharacterized protein YjiS (DUF1127 family)
MLQRSINWLLKEGFMALWNFERGTIGLVTAKERLSAFIGRRRERARLARELMSCNNRELFDLGISSGDIPAIVAGTYRRF